MDERAKQAIISKAIGCEKCLRMADFAENAPEYKNGSGQRIGMGMRKLAKMYADEAMQWAKPRSTT